VLEDEEGNGEAVAGGREDEEGFRESLDEEAKSVVSAPSQAGEAI
jgi:hypothetical protein